MTTISDQRVFLPTKDLDRSVEFYERMGWTVTFRAPDIVLVKQGASHMFLQKAYVKAWAENTMVHLVVDDAHAWHERALRTKAEGAFTDDEVRIRAPFHEDYGATVTHVIDPAGVLLHFAQLDPPG